ncbi:MAG: MFS transporter [Candidatus Binatia bacterium]|nr:MFS transporter [Candidatus Binatia bacterium]
MSDTPQLQTSPAYRNYVLGVLLVMYVFNYLDRYVLTQMIGPIKEDLGVSDTMIGFLIGPAFALFYTLCGVPVARLADVHSRRSIIAAGLVVWSLFTAASGLARSAFQLAVTRVLVGVGEAAGAAPAHSLLSDYFPPERRATALSVFQGGVPLGSMLGLLIGGFLVDAIGWRSTLVAVGLPGILVAIVLRLTVREPERGALDPDAPAVVERVGFFEVARTLARKPTFWGVALGAGIASFAGTGFGFWMPAFLERVHGMSRLEIGLRFGIISNVAGMVGLVVCARITDALGRRDLRWYPFAGALSILMMLPFLGLTLLWPDGREAIYFMIPSGLVGGAWAPIAFSMGQNIAPPHMRATAASLIILAITLLGQGLGPLAVGYANDVLAAQYGEMAIRWSLLGVLSTCGVGAVIFALTARTIDRDYLH